MTDNTGKYTSFEYDTSSELTRVVFPYAGALRWAYRDFTFSGNKTIREVQNRFLTKAAGATEVTYALVRDDPADAATLTHGYKCLTDPRGIGQKCWFFDNNGINWSVGPPTRRAER